MESSADGLVFRSSKQFSKSGLGASDEATASLVSGIATATEITGEDANLLNVEINPDNLPYLGIRTPDDEAVRKVRN